MTDRPFPPPRRRKRGPEAWVRATLAVLGVALAFAAYAGAALSWDGASLFFGFLDIQEPSFPHHRYSVALLQLPTLLAARHTEHVGVLELVYGVTYGAIPAFSAYASWRLVEKPNPRLVVWPLLWIAVGGLAGQFFFVTESLMAIHLAWPLLLMVATGFSPRRVALAAALTAFSFDLHPVSGPLFLLAAAASAALAVERPERRQGLLVAAALLLAFGFGRIWVSLHDAYELSQARVDLRTIFRSLRLPRVAVVATATLPALLVVAQLVKPLRARPLHGVMAAMLVVIAAALVPWGNTPRLWQDELNFRFIAPFAAAPFLLGASVVAVTTTPSNDRLWRSEALLAFGATLVFALVLGAQSRQWLRLRHSLEATLGRSSRCISMNAIAACRTTALKWWPTPSYALVIQGHTPRSLLLPGADCGRKNLDHVIPVNPWYLRSRAIGWFDLTATGKASP